MTRNEEVHTLILPTLSAESDNLNELFDETERQVDLAFKLEQAQKAHAETHAALEKQTEAWQRLNNERQIERTLLAHPSLSPKAVAAVTQLLLRGDGGELEVDKHGKLREKYGTAGLEEVVTNYLARNLHFQSDGEHSAKSGAPSLDRAKMTTKQKADYIDAHGQDGYFKLPYSTPEPKAKK